MAKAKRKKTTKKSSSLLWRIIKSLVLVGLLVAVAGVAYLDIQVRHKFEGSKWALPAHVYSRPLELYQGLALTPSDLAWELQALGYRRISSANKVGQFSVAKNRIEIYSRGFEFWDALEPAQRFVVHFSSGTIERIVSASGRALPLARLEPMMIGGIYPARSEDRELLQINEVPAFLPLGLIAVEDHNFYNHPGVSLRGIARAMQANIKQRRVVQGGSTLTQQLVKNFYLNQQQTLSRKAVEAVMALLLEFHFEKDDILEAYLNEVFLGQAGSRSINGFGLASRHYFNRPVNELELHQAALLIGMMKGASYYNPRKHPQRVKTRRNLVLGQMVEQGIISIEEGRIAKALPLGLEKGRLRIGQFPDYLDLVKRQLKDHYDDKALLSDGLKIFTHFDPQVQRKLENSLQNRVQQIERDYRLTANSIEAASVIVRVGTAEVVALSGGRKAGFSGFNRALDARRPIGSTVKPAVILAALENPQSYSLSTLIDDAPISINLPQGKKWTPRNFERKSHGLVPIYEVLGQSYNQATARLGTTVGIDEVTRVIERLGYSNPIPQVPAITLGAIDMTPYEVTELYHTIAANGFHTPLRTIGSVYNAQYKPLKRYQYSVEERFQPQVMHLLHFSLQVVMREGTGKTAYRKLPKSLVLAGKTGTTNGQRDSWFSGFGGNYLSVVWLGRDDNGKMPITGGTGALQVWTDVMKAVDVSSFPYVQPEGIDYHWVEPHSQKLSGKGCEGARFIPYIKGSQPKQHSGCYKDTGQRVIQWFKDIFGINKQ